MKHFVCGDLHGSWSIYQKLLAKCESYGQEYQLYFLGDACDRGEYGFRIMCDMIDNPNLIYIRGNHEDMFIKAAHELHQIAAKENCSVYDLLTTKGLDLMAQEANFNLQLAIYNGGGSTLKAWAADGALMSFVDALDAKMINYATYKHYDMCHAGTDYDTWQLATSYDAHDECPEELIWNRSHFKQKWEKGRTLIHGHTPVQNRSRDMGYIDPLNPKPAFYNGKINMDTGAIYSNRYYMYDLDKDKLVKIV